MCTICQSGRSSDRSINCRRGPRSVSSLFAWLGFPRAPDPAERVGQARISQDVGNWDVSEPSRGVPANDQVLNALVDICGPDYARIARSIDTVGGRRAGHVAVPATARAVADILRLVA